MDLLYILGCGSKHKDAEIRYSLRSIEKNCKGYDRVFLVGRKPKWLTGVHYYPCDDPYDCTHKNMMHKIMHICHNSDISDDFVMQGDDHFYVRPYDFADISLYEKGVLPTKFKVDENAPKYRTSLIETRQHLQAHGYPIMNASQHCGQPYKKSLLLQVEEELVTPSFSSQQGFEPSSIMAAALNRHYGIPYEHRKDLKVKYLANEKYLLDRIGDNFCFSIYDAAFIFGIEDILKKWFPTPSRFEIN